LAEIEGQLDFMEHQLQEDAARCASLPVEGAAGTHGGFGQKSIFTQTDSQ
jgi:hypothetical protein